MICRAGDGEHREMRVATLSVKGGSRASGFASRGSVGRGAIKEVTSGVNPGSWLRFGRNEKWSQWIVDRFMASVSVWSSCEEINNLPDGRCSVAEERSRD